jgi:hypothetical protein
MLISEILFETAAEIREIEALSKMVIDRAKPIWLKNPRTAIPLRALNLPQFQSPAINQFIQAVVLRVGTDAATTLGSYHAGERELSLSWDLVQNQDTTNAISTLAHEFTHALDAFKGIRFRRNDLDFSNGEVKQDYDKYLRLQHEVDARLTQALLEIGKLIENEKEIHDIFSSPGDPTPTESHFLSRAITSAFTRNQIAELFPTKTHDPQYRRLLTRAYKFYTAPNVAVHANNPTILQRAAQWIKIGLFNTFKR